MDRKELNAAVSGFVKYCNGNKELLSLKEDQVISTKLNVDEMESMCEEIGIEIAENFNEGDVPQEFKEIYNSLSEAFEQYKEENPEKEEAAAAKKTTDSKKGKSKDKPEVKDPPKSDPEKSDTPPPEPEKQKAAPVKKQKAKSASKSSGALDEDMKKAIKKLFESLPEEAIDNLDPTTTRTVLKVIKS